MALACGGWPVIKDMTEMTATPSAMNLGACEDKLAVGFRANGIIGYRPCKTRPSSFAVVFVLGGIELQPAGRAFEYALTLFIVQWTCVGALCAFAAQYKNIVFRSAACAILLHFW